MGTSGVFRSLLLLVTLTSACSGTISEPGGAGGIGTGGVGTGGVGAGGSPDGAGANSGGVAGAGANSGGVASGNSGGAAVDPAGPLLDRPSGAKYNCSVSRPITPFDMRWKSFTLVPGAAETELAVLVANSVIEPVAPTYGVSWSTLDLDGTLGPQTLVYAPTTSPYLSPFAAAGDGGKFTLVWVEVSLSPESAPSLNSMQVDGSGTVVTPASVLTTSARSPGPKLAKAGAGHALVWIGQDDSSANLSFARLDESGRLASSPRVLTEGKYLTLGTFAPIGDRFVVSYIDRQYIGSRSMGRLLVLDSDGGVISEPVVFENGAGTDSFSLTIPSLLVQDDHVLAAWSIVNLGSDGHRAATVRLARFDANGERQGLMYDLQAPVTDREAVQPLLVEMGNDVGLLWADGSVIYVCGGCVPDHSQKFVVLDGQSLNPQSQVAELVNPLPSGGLLSSQALRTGDNLLVVSTVTYHTRGEGASATIRCAN